MIVPKMSIGIIGGAGPMASCQLYQLIINKCQNTYGSVQDANFPEINIISYPFASMLTPSKATKNRTVLIKQLQNCFDRLAQQEAQIIAIACNTLHAFLDSVNIPQTCTFVHIAQATHERAQKLGVRNPLLLSTGTTATSKIYPDFLTPNQNDQEDIDRVITNIMGGHLDIANAQELGKIVNNYSVDGVVLGCTELPLLHAQHPIVIESCHVVLDTLDILAQELVRQSFN